MVRLNQSRKSMRKVLFLLALFLTGQATFFHTMADEKSAGTTQQQVAGIQGTVKDAKGEPLIGVNISVKGAADLGAISDTDGQFSLNTSTDATLQFTLLGYLAQEVKLNGRKSINVVMEIDTRLLEEVVVVAYGTQKKATLTGAISSVGAEDLSRSAATTTSGSLVGKMPGVNSRMPDGRPGASTQINIRNMGTPLYVIDGVQKDEGQFNNIDFNDIESITILKDASASIYGMRAANGVVVVQTKRGNRDGKNTINLNTYYGWQDMFRFPIPADAPTYVRSYTQYETIKGVSDLNRRFKPGDIEKWTQGTEKNYRPFDWYDWILNTAPQWYVGANAQGGSQKVNYYFALSHVNQDDIIRNYGGFYRTNTQINIDASVSEKLKFGASFNGRIETRMQPGVPGGDDIWQGLFSVYRNLPIVRPYANDNPKYPAKTSNNTEVNFAMLNYDLSGKYREDWRVGQLNFNGEYEIVKGLKAIGKFGYYLAQKWMDNQEYTYKLYGYNEADDTYPVVFSMDNPWRERDIRMVEETTAQFQLNYSGQFGKHAVSAFVASEAIQRDTPGFWVHDRPASNALHLMYITTIDTFNDDGKRTEARLGYAGRFNYNFDSKYLFEFSARYDGSWKFPPGHRWGFFPSASVGWRVSSEKFWQSLGVSNWFNDLKLRVSYGLTGNDNVDNYSAFDYVPGYTYKNGGSVLDNKYIIGTVPRGLPNKILSWMKASTFDAGFDFAILNNRLTGQLDYFRRLLNGMSAQRYDVLIPSEAGFGLPYENLNANVHTGFDGGLQWNDKIGDVRYNVGGNLTYARMIDWFRYDHRRGNSWDYYRNNITQRYSYLNWGYHVIGQFQSWEEIAAYPIDNDQQGNISLRPGDLKYEDVNKDGRIDGLDQRPIGYREGGLPYFNFAVNLGASWKGFDLAADFTGAAFASYTMASEAQNPFHDGGNNPQYYMGNQWHLSDPLDINSALVPGKYPTLILGNGGGSNYWKSDFWTKNVNYLKLRNLEIGYTVPSKILAKAGVSKLRIYSLMQNLFSIDNLGDLQVDPELTTGTGLQYPTNRVINIGFNISF